MPPKKANRRPSQNTTGKNMTAAVISLAMERLVRFGPQHNSYGRRGRRPHSVFLCQQRGKEKVFHLKLEN